MGLISEAMDAEPDSPAALKALARTLAAAIDACEDADALERLSRRLLDCLRELGWTPRGVADVSDEWAAFDEYGSATVRDLKGSGRPDAG